MTRVRSRSVSEPNPYYVELHDAFPGLEAAQSAWMSQIDSLTALDRKTHELIRLACTVILRNGPGVERHAKLAAEVGATFALAGWNRRAEAAPGDVVLSDPSEVLDHLA